MSYTKEGCFLEINTKESEYMNMSFVERTFAMKYILAMTPLSLVALRIVQNFNPFHQLSYSYHSNQ